MTENSKARPETVFDSSRQQIGESYARALLNQGQSEGNTATLMQELASFAEVVQDLPKLSGVLESPRVKTGDKERLIDRALSGKASRTFVNFVKLLVRRGRFDCIHAIGQAAVRIQDEVTGQVRGTVTSATPLNEQTVSRLADNLGKRIGRNVILAADVDETIIGGVVVRIGDTVYDASVKNQLQQLKRRAVKNATDAIRNQMNRFASVSDS